MLSLIKTILAEAVNTFEDWYYKRRSKKLGEKECLKDYLKKNEEELRET